jgi:hypothetical protein
MSVEGDRQSSASMRLVVDGAHLRLARTMASARQTSSCTRVACWRTGVIRAVGAVFAAPLSQVMGSIPIYPASGPAERADEEFAARFTPPPSDGGSTITPSERRSRHLLEHESAAVAGIGAVGQLQRDLASRGATG